MAMADAGREQIADQAITRGVVPQASAGVGNTGGSPADLDAMQDRVESAFDGRDRRDRG